MLKRMFLALSIAASATSATATDGIPNNADGIEAKLQVEVARLKKENEALRRENQRLRAQLVEKNNGNAAGAVTSQSKTEAASANVEYWLTTSSKKRHNSKCRYFKSSKGRPCGKDEGIPCKSCGG